MSYRYASNIEMVGNPNDPDRVYYNADIINISNSEPAFPQIGDNTIVNFTENRSIPIINDISGYAMSILRFSSSCGWDLPLFIPSIQIGQSNINLTVYNITINMNKIFVDAAGNPQTYVGYATLPIIYESETTAYINYQATLPNPPLVEQQITPYYYVYTYDHFCYLFNKTVGLIFAQLQAQYTAYIATFPGGGAPTNPLITSQPPKLVYDGTTNLFSIYYDVNGWGDATTNNTTGQTNFEAFNMSFNGNLFNLLTNFENLYVGTQNLNSQVNKLIVTNKNWTNLFVPPATIPAHIAPQPSTGYWVMTQNYPSTDNLWSPIEAIVFCSNLLPVLAENVSAPTVYGQENNNTVVSSSSNYQPIITDITLDQANGARDWRSFTVYVPAGQYRYSTLTRSRQSLSNIDIQVFWRNRLDGSLTPLRMPNDSNVSIKILFEKKNV